MAEQSLKKQNFRYIVPWLVFDIAGCWALLKGGDLLTSVAKAETWYTSAEKGVFFSALLTSLSFLLSGLLSTNAKLAVVFWRVKHALPGHRAFTDVAAADHRIDLAALTSKLGALPDEPDLQNKLWYKLYKQHEHDPRVQDPHQHYLLFRDMAAISICFLVLECGFWATHLYPSTGHGWVILALTIQYVLCVMSARNSANRFVANVLALEAVATKPTTKRKGKADAASNL